MTQLGHSVQSQPHAGAGFSISEKQPPPSGVADEAAVATLTAVDRLAPTQLCGRAGVLLQQGPASQPGLSVGGQTEYPQVSPTVKEVVSSWWLKHTFLHDGGMNVNKETHQVPSALKYSATTVMKAPGGVCTHILSGSHSFLHTQPQTPTCVQVHQDTPRQTCPFPICRPHPGKAAAASAAIVNPSFTAQGVMGTRSPAACNLERGWRPPRRAVPALPGLPFSPRDGTPLLFQHTPL